MTVIIRKSVHTARISHKCDDCGRTIQPSERYTRMFGNAEDNERPYEIKVCATCKDPNVPTPDGYEYIRRVYGIPVSVGQTVECNGRRGTVSPAREGVGAYVWVKIGRKVSNWHPTWETVYYNEDGTIAADYRAKKPEEVAV